MPSKTMSVVALAAIVGAAAAASKPVDPAVEVRRLTADFEYVGCFHDGNGEEIGSLAHEGHPDDEFLQECAESCAGSMYFGTQYGIEVVKCFCEFEGDLGFQPDDDPSSCRTSCTSSSSLRSCLSAVSVYEFTGGVDTLEPTPATPVEPTEEPLGGEPPAPIVPEPEDPEPSESEAPTDEAIGGEPPAPIVPEPEDPEPSESEAPTDEAIGEED